MTTWRSAWAIGFIAVMASQVGACHEGELGRGLGATCDESSPCRAPYGCEYGRCRSSCAIDDDCPAGACVQSTIDPNAGVCTVAAEQGCDAFGCPKGLTCAADELCRTACDSSHPCGGSKLCVLGGCFDKEPSTLPDAGPDGADANVPEAGPDAAEEDGAAGTGGQDAADDVDAGLDAPEDSAEEGGTGGTGGQDAADEPESDGPDDAADASGGGSGAADAAEDQDASAGSGGVGGLDASDEDVSTGGTGGTDDAGTGDSGACVTERAWYDLSPAGTPPSARSGFAYAYDPLGRRMIIVGGFDQADPGGSQMDVWELSLEQSGTPSWTSLAPTGSPPPAPRRWSTLVYDDQNQRMILFAGQRYFPPYDYSYYQDLYALELPHGGQPAWVALTPTGAPPSARSMHTAIMDVANHRMILFGGADSNSAKNDVWQLSLPASGTPVWQQLQPTGGAPQERADMTAVYDEGRQRMIVFGGGTWAGQPLNDVWAMSLPSAGAPAWDHLTPSGPTPAATQGHTAVIDQATSTMLVFGGSEWLGLSLAVGVDGAWSVPPSATASPAPRGWCGAVWDPLGSRMALFGGRDTTDYNDTYAWGPVCVDADAGAGDSSSDAADAAPPCVVQIAAGGGHTCARKGDGTLWCWGDNTYGQVGDGTTASPNPSPSQVTSLGTSVVDVVAGAGHTCVRKNDGTVWCWGRNEYGQLGDGAFTGQTCANGKPCSPAPLQVQTLGTTATHLWRGGLHTCASQSGGTAWCWGFNAQGELGDGTAAGVPGEGGAACRPAPVQVTAVGANLVELAGPGASGCSRKADGSAWCWGNSDTGLLGNGVTSGQPCGCCYQCQFAAVQVSLLGTQVAELSGGGEHACARKLDGSVWCWGRNEQGQLGNGAIGGESCGVGSSCQPAPVQALLTGVATQLSLSSYGSCALKDDSTVWCWGDNAGGQTGDGTVDGIPCGSDKCRSAPVQVTGLTGVEEITLGGGHACARKSDGTVWCWGINNAGQLGNGTTGGQACGSYTCEPAPVQVQGLCP